MKLSIGDYFSGRNVTSVACVVEQTYILVAYYDNYTVRRFSCLFDDDQWYQLRPKGKSISKRTSKKVQKLFDLALKAGGHYPLHLGENV